MDPVSHRGPAVVLLLLTAIILEVLRRIFGLPRVGDLRGSLFMAALALAIAAGILLAFAFLSHTRPFSN
jgi:hypothetical protein